MVIHSIKKIQIKTKTKDQVGTLSFDKACTKILTKYFNYSNIFLAENIAELQKYIRINNNVIKQAKNKKLLFESIDNLKSIELEIIKTYIQTNLTHNFI